jgi:hypothetical protein
MILYLKDPKELHPKTSGHHEKLQQLAGYKINSQNSVVFLYSNNEQIEKEYGKTITFIIASKKSNT